MSTSITKAHIEKEKNNPNKDHHNVVNEALRFPIGTEFEKDLNVLLDERSENQGRPIIIALYDFDHFMAINDNYGYDVGDMVLIDTGKHFEAGMPKGAKMYRFGGDEFGIIFDADMEKEEVFLLLESLRRSLEVKLPNGELATISIGVATAFEDANRVPELIRKAESALFRAKNNGRNKIALAKEEKMVPKTSHFTQDQLSSLTKLSKREGIGEAILLREALDMLLKKYDV